jgi:hypothetical protein
MVFLYWRSCVRSTHAAVHRMRHIPGITAGITGGMTGGTTGFLGALRKTVGVL